MKMAATWPREPCGVGESLMPWTVMGLELTRVLGRLGNSPSTVMCFLHWGAEEGQFGSGLQSSKEGGERGMFAVEGVMVAGMTAETEVKWCQL